MTSIINNRLKYVELFVRYEANVNVVNNANDIVLLFVCEVSKETKFVKMLLEEKVDVQTLNKNEYFSLRKLLRYREYAKSTNITRIFVAKEFESNWSSHLRQLQSKANFNEMMNEKSLIYLEIKQIVLIRKISIYNNIKQLLFMSVESKVTDFVYELAWKISNELYDELHETLKFKSIDDSKKFSMNYKIDYFEKTTLHHVVNLHDAWKTHNLFEENINYVIKDRYDHIARYYATNHDVIKTIKRWLREHELQWNESNDKFVSLRSMISMTFITSLYIIFYHVHANKIWLIFSIFSFENEKKFNLLINKATIRKMRKFMSKFCASQLHDFVNVSCSWK